MILIENLTKRFGPLTAVDGVSFEVAEGEVLGFLGPNGAGKTTTLRVLTGFLTPDQGRVTVGGLDPGRHPLAVRRMLGYLPENVPLYPEMFVDEYLDFVARVKGAAGGSTARAARIGEVVASCRLEKVRRRQIRKLSKGFRQRVGLAQALLGDPAVLVLDEPTIGLDPTQIVEMRNLIKTLGETKTIILSSHILPEVGQTCSRVVIIADGRLVAQDTPQGLADRTGSGRRLSVTVEGDREAAEKVFAGLPGLTGWKPTRPGTDGGGRWAYSLKGRPGCDIRAEAARELVRAGLDLLELKSEEVSLEEVFVKLVTEEGPAGGREAVDE